MITGYDAHGNFLPQQQLIDDIERLQAERAGDQQRLLHYETEIERLRAELEAQYDHNANLDRDIERLRADRDAVIEECARMAENWGDGPAWHQFQDIAAGIRALKSDAGG